jgi:hypothetical protein
MNIELRRYGIVIKTTRLTGDKASIGSGTGCDILIEDPYLAAHVGDLVKRGDTWYITDTGTSLDGITRDGERVDDEAIIDGQVYSIGGFELVAQLGAGVPRSTQAASPRADRVVPGTVIEELPRPRSAAIPGTVVEPIANLRRQAEIPKTVFEALPPRPAPVAAPPAAPPRSAPAAAPVKSGPRFRRIAFVAMGLMVLLLLIVVVGGGKKKPVATKAAPQTESVAVKATPAPAVAPPAAPLSAPDHLSSLRYDRALQTWEKELAKSDDPQTRARYAELAVEIGRIHAANRSSDATGYFERAVKWGPAGNAAVAEAKRRLAQ